MGLEKVSQSFLTSNCKKSKSKSPMENQQILMEMFKARDSGDEKESKLEALGIDADIEKDGDDICDYTWCRTARDFENVARNSYQKQQQIYTKKYDTTSKIIKKFCKLSKQKGWKMPTVDDLVYYILHSDCYQDKLKFYKELIEIYRLEIDRELKKLKDDDYKLPF